MAPHNMQHSCGTPILLDIPTELLIRILSYLPPVDLCAMQRSCRRIHAIVADSTYLHYILLAQISGVDDLLPPNFPFSDRIERLKYHEQSWNNLQLNPFHSFPSDPRHLYSLQDGYLIYNFSITEDALRYGYVDLRSADPNEPLRWVNISVAHIGDPMGLVTAVDHNLVVVLRY
jgi:F-box-like